MAQRAQRRVPAPTVPGRLTTGLPILLAQGHLASDGAGNLHSIWRGIVTKIGGGQVSTYADVQDGFYGAIAADQQGKVFVATSNGNSIIRIAPDGSTSSLPTVPIFAPEIAADGVGNVYAVGVLQPLVYQITPGGIASSYFDATSVGPRGLAADMAGNLYVLGTDSLTQVTPQRAVATLAAGLVGPRAVSVDPVGNVFVAETFQAPSGRWMNSVDQVAGGSLMPIVQFPTDSPFDGVAALVVTPTPIDVPEPGGIAVIGLIWLSVIARRCGARSRAVYGTGRATAFE